MVRKAVGQGQDEGIGSGTGDVWMNHVWMNSRVFSWACPSAYSVAEAFTRPVLVPCATDCYTIFCNVLLDVTPDSIGDANRQNRASARWRSCPG
jgi:hypothetical protein